MSNELPHISVCICTYKRPELLKRLLTEVAKQQTDGKFTYSVVLADNDPEESARTTVAEMRANSNLLIKYCSEPRRGIAHVRNKVIENSEGEYVAFIDDDEPEVLFIIFRDATSGKETYGVGRYVYVARTPDGKTILDFNKAFNPLCAYGPLFFCPIPPKQNHLPVPIPAGEKPYGHL